jgi:hypothetical protein
MARGKEEVAATTTFVTHHEGVEVEVRKGERLDVAHPIVEGHREFFEKPKLLAKPKRKPKR